MSDDEGATGLNEVAPLWDQVEKDGSAKALTNDEVRLLHLWCWHNDIALPPARWVAEEAGRRELA